MTTPIASGTGAPELPAKPTFQQAFEAAKVEHSPKGEQAGAAAEVSTEEGKTAATAASELPAGGDGKTPASEKPKDTETETLISEDGLAALKTKHANDPDGLVREVNKVLTQKLQEVAELRKGFTQYSDLMADYDKDPAGTITKIAEGLGLQVVAPKREAETAKAATAAKIDETMAKFKTALGPELEFLADKIAPVMRELAESIAQTTANEAVEPLKAATSSLISKAVEEQTNEIMQSFEKTHPDYKQYHDQMMELAGKLGEPKPGSMTSSEYLDMLYRMVTRDRDIAAETKKTVERLSQGAATAEPASRSATSEAKVTTAPTHKPSLKEAHEAAKQGVRWERAGR
jgi:hypothetical protein